MRSFTVYISEIVSWRTSFWWCKASTATSFVFFPKHETLKKKSINIFFHFNFDCLFSPSVTTVHCCTNIVQSHLLPKQKWSGCEWYKIILLNIFLYFFLGVTNLILLSRDWMVSCLLKHLTRKIKSKVTWTLSLRWHPKFCHHWFPGGGVTKCWLFSLAGLPVFFILVTTFTLNSLTSH